MTTPQPPTVRSTLVDNAKAFGIVLVVIGHAPAIPAALVTFIFAFHMPLFFFLSGWLVTPTHVRQPTAARAARLGRTLLVPYAFYFLLSYVWWLVAKRHGVRAGEFEALAWWQPLTGLLEGTGDALFVNVVLWFFPCLFAVAMLYHLARRRLGVRTAAVVFAGIAFCFIVARPQDLARWPWSLDCAMVALAFYAAGPACRRIATTEGMVSARIPLVLSGTLAVAGCCALTLVTGHTDLNRLAFGSVPTLYLPTAALGIAGTLAWSARLPVGRVARWLSRHTLVVFPLHLLLFSVFTGIAVLGLGLDPSFKESTPLVGVFYVVAALALCWPAAAILRALFPCLFQAIASDAQPTSHPVAIPARATQRT